MSLASYFKKRSETFQEKQSLFICDRNTLFNGGLANDDHTILYSGDVKSAMQFYVRAFGLKCEFLHENMNLAELTNGWCRIINTGVNSELTNLTLLTPNIHHTFNQALTVGAISVQTPNKSSKGDLFALIRDKSGFLIELIQED